MSNPISYLNVNRETCKTKFIQAISGLTIPSENSATRIAIIFCRIESLIRPLFPYQASNFSISSKSASLDHGTAQGDAHKLCRQTKHQRIPFADLSRDRQVPGDSIVHCAIVRANCTIFLRLIIIKFLPSARKRRVY